MASLSVSRRVLQVLIRLNVVAGVLIAALLVASLVAEGFVMTALGVPPTNENGSILLGMRAIMVLGIASVPLAHTLLSRLLAIVDTVRDGDPFISVNAARLRQIAWAVLGLEVLHTIIAATAAAVSTATTPIDIERNLNITRWLVVLLMFVLSRVFEHGTQMREELEGTV
jgi:hypothetical protein